MSKLSRRQFLRGVAAAGAAGSLALAGAPLAGASDTQGGIATLIDLTLCDGCQGEKTQRCVSACRLKNQSRFPRVDRANLQPYWPQAKYEDWSDKVGVTDRLTPYNWTYVQKVSVEQGGRKQEVFVPRRCMHCDNPPCANVCPFSAQTKTPEGPVIIDENLCFGGAKCRDVCPWGIPQRQAGVGLYLEVAPKFAGGGVMYKCDLCIDRIREGKTPSCVNACPRGAIGYGSREEIRAEAHRRAAAIGGHIYGETENGGTSTLYVSAVPFDAIHEAMQSQAMDGKPGRPAMPVAARNFSDAFDGLAGAVFASPVVGMMAAGALAVGTLRRRGEEAGGAAVDSEVEGQ
jgi:Fe-S-cluster-containing dehydrogenase component